MEIFNRIKKNALFKFISSVKLAVPLMLILALVVAVGTIYESKYNSEYARLMIYNTYWFSALMILLWINIFCSTISRIPYRVHHTGFVIVHIGLMTLLVGGLITNSYGIDGQLRVSENSAANTVVLPGYVVGYQFEGSPTAQTIPFHRMVSEVDYEASDSVNNEIRNLFYIKKYLPFSRVDRVYASTGSADDGIGVSVIMKNQMFNVSEWLHSKDNPEIQMGPATLRLIVDSENVAPLAPVRKIKKATPKLKATATSEPKLIIKDRKSGSVLGQFALKKLPQTIQGTQISLVQKYGFAVVAQNKLVEGNPQENKPNPALELRLENDGKSQREVVYAKFPDFSMNKDGSFGLSFTFEGADLDSDSAIGSSQPDEMPANHPGISGGLTGAMSTRGNLIEFHVKPGQEQVTLKLFKDGAPVAEQILPSGQSFVTPWMGIKVTIGTIINGGKAVQEARAVGLTAKMDLPPSSLQIQVNSEETPFWLSEGDSRVVDLMGRKATVFFARQTIDLPFKLFLNKFSKLDYPGTETPMSYQSLVKVENTNETQLISMNEPLKKDGFTIYQASYVLEEGRTPESIFSVNRDPGRPIKYTGSLILCLGIIIFTLMRSRWWKSMQARGGKI